MQIINGVQCRTREESLRHIVKRAKLKKIGPKTEREAAGSTCEYRYSSGNNCAVGSLFSKAQLLNIEAKGENESAILYLADSIGRKNIETVTGMRLKELEKLQDIHDTAVQDEGAQPARNAVIAYCEEELKKLKKTSLDDELGDPLKSI